MRTSRANLRSLFVLALTFALVAAFSLPAGAHVKVKKTSPKKGGSACTSIKKSTVTFTGPIIRGTLKVFKISDGQKVSKGTGGRAAGNINKLKTKLKKNKLTSGSYRAKWTILAADGHNQKGKFKFSLSNC